MSWNILKQKRKAPPSKEPRRGKTSSKLDSSFIETQAAKGCAGCPLNKARLESPKMPPTGATLENTEVYILGEAPGREEDEQGKQFVGPSGRLLRNEIPKELDAHVRWNNTIRCRPPNNREPALLEVACCRSKQEEDIAQSKPKIVMGFGNVPLTWMLGPNKNISAWRGRFIPINVQGHKCWFMPVLHPSYILRKRHARDRKGEAIEDLFRRDIYAALTHTPAKPNVYRPRDKDKGVEILLSYTSVIKALNEARRWEEFGIDIETNALRPYAAGAKILSVAISNYEKTFAFPLGHREAKWTARELDRIEDSLETLLTSGGMPIAHHSKFEQEWLAWKFGPSVIIGVDWQDTMAQTYILDERQGAKSLEAVSLINLGMNVKALRTRSGRHVNVADLDNQPLPDVLDYNAYDAKYVHPIFFKQLDKLEEENLVSVYSMQNERAGPFALAQLAGMTPDVKAATAFNQEYQERIVQLERDIQKNKDVVHFVKEHGRFLPSSPKNVLELMYHKLGFKECEVGTDRLSASEAAKLRREGKIKLSTDEDALSKIDHPVARAVLDLRQVNKMRSTYIEPLLEGGKHIWPDGLIHTTYNHLVASTGRTTSEEPNLQNFPRRVNQEVRRVIVAPPGHVLVAFDYGQIEARVIAMASKCEVLVKALWEGYDIHGEWTSRIAHAYPAAVGGKRFLKDAAALKELRDRVKNQWTFPLFFGSVLESVANDLEIPSRILSPLYDDFWETFDTVLDWQDKLKKFYRKNGYVETLTRRRRHGPMSFNEIVNSPIQGTASDIVVDASVLLSRMAYEKKRPTLQWRMNVHDDLTFALLTKNNEQDIATIGKLMVTPRFDFINVPLMVEVKVGKNWCDMKEIAKVSSVDFGHKRNSV